MYFHYCYDYLRTFGARRIGVCVFVNLLGVSIWMIPAVCVTCRQLSAVGLTVLKASFLPNVFIPISGTQ